MKRPATDEAVEAAQALLRRGLALALHDVGQGRAELLAAAAALTAQGDSPGSLLAAAALVVFIGIADENYTGFEAAAATVMALHAQVPASVPAHLPAHTPACSDPNHTLLIQAGALVAGWFTDPAAPGLTGQADIIAKALSASDIAAPIRCCAGLAVLALHGVRMDLPGVLWLELAMRPLLADPAIGERLADEAFHLFVQTLYQCEGPAEAAALRAQRALQGRAPVPDIALKMALLDAQMAIGHGHIEAGSAALAVAQQLLHPHALHPASWWHLLRSRLALLQGQHRQALTHARLSVRLGAESRMPERWRGVGIMQEGQVLMTLGRPAQAVAFFERAGQSCSGVQAQFCVCLMHLARAMAHLANLDAEPAAAARHPAAAPPAAARDAADLAAGLAELAAGLALARQLEWLGFFRASPEVAAAVCAAAIEHGVEAPFACAVVTQRALPAVRPDLAAWPWPIRVRTLGALHIQLHGQPLAFKGKVARRPLALLLFIVACGGVDVSAATAAFGLWPELEGHKAHAALSAALHRLRKLLGFEDAVRLEHGRLGVNPKWVWVDSLAFEQQVAQVGMATAADISTPARLAAERAQALYAGAFLQGADDAAWQLTYRARLASQFKRMVTLLAQAASARGDSAAAGVLLARGLEFDPLAEDLARELMRGLIAAGEQAGALAVFERCRLAIAQDLGAKPAPATLALQALALARG